MKITECKKNAKSYTLVLLTNIGSPNSSSYVDVYQYLCKFLSDPYLIDLPRVFWLPLVYLCVVPLRLKRIASQYDDIVIDGEMPLNKYMLSCAKSSIANIMMMVIFLKHICHVLLFLLKILCLRLMVYT